MSPQTGARLRPWRIANLFCAAVMVGNEFGGWVAVHPALATLPLPWQVAAEKAITARYKAIMPYLMMAAIMSALPVLGRFERRRSPAFLLQLAGTGCFCAMLAVTLLGNMPINNRILAASPESPPAEWHALRRRWDRLHTVRNVLNLCGYGALLASAFADGHEDETSAGGA